MQKKDCYQLGFIFKAHGVKGALSCITNFQLSEELIKTWESIFLEIEGILVPFFIEQINIKSNDNLILKLEDIDNETATKEYIKLPVFIAKEKIENANKEMEISTLIGYTMFNPKQEEIGEIIDIIEYPSQWMFCVDYNNKEILIPAQEEFILELDEENNKIIISLPEGLLDL